MNTPQQPVRAFADFIQTATAVMQAAALETDPAQSMRWIRSFLDAHGLTPAPATPETHYSAHAAGSGIDIRRIVSNRYPCISQAVVESTASAMKTGRPDVVAKMAVDGWLRQHRPPYIYAQGIAPGSFHGALAKLMRDQSARNDLFQDMYGNTMSAKWADDTLEKALATAPPQVIETLHEAAYAALTRMGWVEVEEDEQQPASAGVFA